MTIQQGVLNQVSFRILHFPVTLKLKNSSLKFNLISVAVDLRLSVGESLTKRPLEYIMLTMIGP